MVLAVSRDPCDHRSLEGGRSERTEQAAQPPGRLEGPVREVPVKPDCYSEPDRDVRSDEDHQVMPMESPIPNLPGDQPKAQEGNSGHDRAGSGMESFVLERGDVRHGRTRAQFHSGT